ncbi:agamous-like MADS-box protein AGL80 [Trifolium pratense]|uniref:agamous-like MADS-box protein AGL80 n=1 Tax=Trifolium pratense TaxID=57577 RepID=UPI001E691ED5|nr:agamous-like MADS-box protein AGL80 [Trifolium pratense]
MVVVLFPSTVWKDMLKTNVLKNKQEVEPMSPSGSWFNWLNCLLKKVNELSTLCGVEACIIIYPENSAQPDIWPPGLRTRNVLGKFMSLPELERNKKMLDSEGFANQTLEKTQKILMKQIEKNQKKSGIFISDTYKNLECDTRDLNINEANNWKGFIEKRLNEVEQKLISIKIQAEEETENGIEAVNGIANLGHVADA